MYSQVTPSTACFDATHLVQSNRVLTREEGQKRLKHLVPGTEEHRMLQEKLIMGRGIEEIFPSADSSYKVNTLPSQSKLLGGFGSSEHYAIGEAVILKGVQKESDPTILTAGFVPLCFKQIVSLAGDFYGIYGEPISLLGGTDEEKTQRFIKAFNTLENADNGQLRQILLAIDDEYSQVKYSGTPHHCYSHQMMEKHRKLQQIKPDLEKLLIDNSDHFSKDATEAYRIGHAYAISVAREAGLKKDTEGLKKAYAIDAFANHFLTDLFSAGHIRNERGNLEVYLRDVLKFSPDQAKPLAGILTGAQHEKDGNDGLNVLNKRNEYWRAYGDGSYFLPKNGDNKKKVIAAVQESVNEVYQAFSDPDQIQESIVDQCIPEASAYNPLPLYSIIDNVLYLRQYVKGEEVNDNFPISTKVDYLNHALAHAARFFPDSYVVDKAVDFFKDITRINKLPTISIPPLVQTIGRKLILAGVERMTGSVWNTIGLASYHQVKKESKQLNDKIDEVADTIMATHKNTVQILSEIQKVQSKLQDVHWEIVMKEINDPIGTIKAIAYEYKTHINSLEDSQIDESIKGLWNSYTKLSSVFHGTSANGTKILEAYSKLLRSNNNAISDREVVIEVTSWFRQMFNFQIQAYSLYVSLRMRKHDIDENKIRMQIIEMQKSLTEQVETNKSHIDESIIYESEKVIFAERDKCKAKRSMQQALLLIDEK